MAFFSTKDLGWEGWENTVNVRISAGTDKVEIIRSLQKAMEKFTPGHDFHFRFMDQVLDNAYRNELRFTKHCASPARYCYSPCSPSSSA